MSKSVLSTGIIVPVTCAYFKVQCDSGGQELLQVGARLCGWGDRPVAPTGLLIPGVGILQQVGRKKSLQLIIRRGCDKIFWCKRMHKPHRLVKEMGYTPSMMSYQDVEIAAHCYPPLTTVRQPTDLMGQHLIHIWSQRV
jgi:hypothetical protein